MRVSTISTVIFFFLYFIYKLFGNNDNDYWVCGFWLTLSTYISIISIQIAYHLFNKIAQAVWYASSAYWSIMIITHVFFMFRIDLYDIYASSANTFTLGASLIVIMFAFLILKISRLCRKRGGIE